MIFITKFDVPAFWQTYLSDPASITMEGILIFNKHLLFLLTAIVLFIGSLLFDSVYSFRDYWSKCISITPAPLKLTGSALVINSTKELSGSKRKAEILSVFDEGKLEEPNADICILIAANVRRSSQPGYSPNRTEYDCGMKPTSTLNPNNFELVLPTTVGLGLNEQQYINHILEHGFVRTKGEGDSIAVVGLDEWSYVHGRVDINVYEGPIRRCADWGYWGYLPISTIWGD